MSTKHLVARLDGGMRFVVQTGSGHEVVSDSGEGNTGPRPTEFVLVGLAACTGMDVITILRKKRQMVESYEVEVTGIQRVEAPDVFTRIDVTHVVSGEGIATEAVRRAIELSAYKYCPVASMLCAGTVELHHSYRVVDSSDGASPPIEGLVAVRGPGAPVDVPVAG